MNLCRICKNESVKKVGEYQPYLEHKYDVYDCPNCGCRFVWREKDIHESLHSTPQSPYSSQVVLASEIQNYWRHKETYKMCKFLSKTPQFKFVIDNISEIGPNNKSFLEVGCSRGYLSAYFLLSGYNIIGVDISPTAIKSAISNFGNHFKIISDEDFSHFRKFDVIFHIGTIGCVNDPIKFTRNLLDILKPTGKLLFNAPNIQAVIEMNAIWNNGTPPPDLITTFPESFWYKFFLDTADVEITYEPYDHKSNLTKHLRKLLGMPYIDPKVVSIYDVNPMPASSRPYMKKVGSVAFRVAPYVTRYLLPRYASEFGMFICMTKR